MITARPLTAADFAPYGDVLDASGDPDRIINAGMCGRYHDRARLDFADGGRAGLSIFNATPRTLPYALDLLERHPLGAQAFVPMTQHPFLVIVAQDANGQPGQIEAFVTTPGQAINFHRGTWHGVLTPLHSPGLFAVVDYIGAGDNLEEVILPAPITVTVPPELR
ncbi:ureidoglycolate hydrolase [Ketogulonicigenium robustum]|uniref:Ureidoglycolate hydrolase n=1 Tax=Ketogulonicigenium robustum TaxID=92947 RepID=A0A1W6NXY7_9RHOB|nr:ureidoglycolate lyase [Ketogulonicigenium robustum]ARO14108.1 ureidoglycolate hydrolase [Ketogulonicigenium robustum]